MELLSLKFLADFFADLTKNILQDRLEPLTRAGKARRVAFDVYSQLQRIQFLLGEFIAALQRYIEALEHSDPEARKLDIWLAEWTDSNECLTELVTTLMGLIDMCEQMHPQISIYLPDVVKTLRYVVFDRSNPLPTAGRSVKDRVAELNQQETSAIFADPAPQLRVRLDKARSNAADVECAVVQLRDFIPKEWSFKDAF